MKHSSLQKLNGCFDLAVQSSVILNVCAHVFVFSDTQCLCMSVFVFSDTQCLCPCVCLHMCLSSVILNVCACLCLFSVILNVCARVFVFSDTQCLCTCVCLQWYSMYVHMCLSSVILNVCARLCATRAQTLSITEDCNQDDHCYIGQNNHSVFAVIIMFDVAQALPKQ